MYSNGVQKGQTYQLRYRAWNVNGPGLWSLNGYVLAAQVPSRPPTPIYISSNESSVIIGLNPSEDNGGLTITRYVL